MILIQKNKYANSIINEFGVQKKNANAAIK